MVQLAPLLAFTHNLGANKVLWGKAVRSIMLRDTLPVWGLY
jgi:hypothetical protein